MKGKHNKHYQRMEEVELNRQVHFSDLESARFSVLVLLHKDICTHIKSDSLLCCIFATEALKNQELK